MSVLDKLSLKGKVGIVTGSGQGIGRAIARALAEAGADLALVGMNVWSPKDSERQLAEVGEELADLGVKTKPIVADMRRPEDVEAMVKAALAEFGKVDLVVNNVGGGTIPTPLLELTEERWQEGLQENLHGTFLVCRAVAPHMVARKNGAIVNVSAMAAIGPAPLYAHYGAAKAGVISLTQTLAAELAPHAVRVNAIVPYLVRTERVHKVMEADPALESHAAGLSPLHRLAMPDEVAALALFLASDASSYMTGEAVRLTGGALPGAHVRVVGKN